MAQRTLVAGIAGRLPGRTKQGSIAYYRKDAMVSSRSAMKPIVDNYERLIRHLKNVTPEALRNALQPVFDKSQEYVPVDKGALKESGRLSVTSSGGLPEAEIVYGDTRAWYAAIVHEYVWLNHAAPTRAKYLQSAMEEEFDSFMTSLAIDYASALT